MKKVKRRGARKGKILSCNNDTVVAKTAIEIDGVKIRKGSKGQIIKQRRTPEGGRATVSFKGKGTIEVPTSKVKCG